MEIQKLNLEIQNYFENEKRFDCTQWYPIQLQSSFEFYYFSEYGVASTIFSNFYIPVLVLTNPIPVNISLNKLAPKVPKNIPKNPHFCSFSSFTTVLLAVFSIFFRKDLHRKELHFHSFHFHSLFSLHLILQCLSLFYQVDMSYVFSSTSKHQQQSLILCNCITEKFMSVTLSLFSLFICDFAENNLSGNFS